MSIGSGPEPFYGIYKILCGLHETLYGICDTMYSICEILYGIYETLYGIGCRRQGGSFHSVLIGFDVELIDIIGQVTAQF